jgi:hypothetical protein
MKSPTVHVTVNIDHPSPKGTRVPWKEVFLAVAALLALLAPMWR